MKSLVSLLALGIIGVLYLANALHGNLNQDEGWYLLAARSVSEGQMPYRDFAFTQAPVLPYVYSLLSGVIREYGVLGGRLITQAFGGLAILFSVLLAARLASPGARRNAALTCLILVGINVYQSYFFTIVKTYSLCSAFFMLGLFLLACSGRNTTRPTAWLPSGIVPFFAGLCLAFAAGTRISAGLAMPIAGLFLLFNFKRSGHRPWLFFGFGGALGLALVFLPLFLAAPEAMKFGIIEYHHGRVAENLLTLKAGFISRVTQAYLLALAVLGILILLKLPKPARTLPATSPKGLAFALWLILAAITGLHLSAAFPYDDYQVFLFPLLGALIASSLMSALTINPSAEQALAVPSPEDPTPQTSAAKKPKPRLMPGLGMIQLLFLALATATAFSSQTNQDWFVEARDRIWWKMKPQSDVKTLQEVGDWIQSESEPGDLLLTQDAYLAIEADRPVPSGLEMGPFSYYPEMANEQAELLHLHNKTSLQALIQTTTAPIAALSGYSFTIACPQVEELASEHQQALQAELEKRYRLDHEKTSFGQGHTTLRILRLHDAAVSPPKETPE